MDDRTFICVFAKPPRPGAAKTRLASEVGPESAARLAHAFLQDTWAAVSALSWARPILATTELDAGELALPGADTWLQGEGDLGERLERVMRRALLESPLAIAIGADTPGLPPSLLAQAREALSSAEAVLGPCEDGGFYLIGLRSCPPGLLRNLPWSAPDTFDRTLTRLRNKGLQTAVLPPWFDVDRPSDLERLRLLLGRGEIAASETARALAKGEGGCP